MDIRYHHFHDRSISRSAADGKLASEQLGALPHSQDSQRSTGRKLLWVDSAAVIANLEDNIAILPAQPDLHLSCLAVTRAVRPRVLSATENGSGPLPTPNHVPVRHT